MLTQFRKDVTLNSDTSKFRLIDANGDNPATAADRAVCVVEHGANSGDDEPGVFFGQVQIECTDTTVSKGDKLVADGSGNGTVVADSSTAGDYAVAVALEDCDASGQYIECWFCPIATPNA